MAQATNTFDTFDSVGEREDFSDIIYNISPIETPFMSNAGRAKATGVYTEWQTDSLAAAATNTQIEGDDATGASLAATTRIGNYEQISRKVVVISDTLDAVDKAGRKKETAYQLTKAGMELKRDIEYACVRNQASSAGSSGTARATASVESWIATNKVDNGAGTTPGFASGTVAAPTDGTTRTFTEALLKTAIQNAWTQGGNPRIIMVGPTNKQKVSAFSGIATLYRDTPAAGQATIIGAADVYVSDFGVHSVVPNRFSRDRTALVLDMDYWSIAYLRDIQQTPLSKTGDAVKRMIIAEYGVVSKNEAASAKVSELN